MVSAASVICKVLIVDDSPMIVKRIQHLLEEIDSVQFLGNACSVASAMEILAACLPEVMILDINLGSSYEMNGVEFLHRIRGHYPGMKIIMFTNLSDDRYRNQCMAGGADYFFDKSNDFDKIPETLKLITQRMRDA